VRRQLPSAFVTGHENIRPGQDGGGHMDGIWRALCGCFSPQFGRHKKHVADDWQQSILMEFLASTGAISLKCTPEKTKRTDSDFANASSATRTRSSSRVLRRGSDSVEKSLLSR
jgi:hypothetical protein